MMRKMNQAMQSRTFHRQDRQTLRHDQILIGVYKLAVPKLIKF